MKKYKILILFGWIVLFSCNNDNDNYIEVSQKHFNIIFAPDLSNRITNKNYIISDEVIASSFCSIFYPNLVNLDGETNQMDKICFDFINPTHGTLYGLTAARVDLGKFGYNQLDRVNYLKVFDSISQFKMDIDTFVNQFHKYSLGINDETDHGSDIYTYIKNLNYLLIDTNSTKISDKSKGLVVNSKFENVIVLLTDGYIEVASGSNDNSPNSTSLSEKKINDFRKAYMNANKVTPITVENFFKTSEYRIKPINNPALKNVKVIVLQLYDRGHTEGGNLNPGPTDLEIMKLFWKEWLMESGIKEENIGLYSCYDLKDATSTINVFNQFLGL